MPEIYHRVLPWLHAQKGSVDSGAEILGAHLEGPFIAKNKKGAHNIESLKSVTDNPSIVKQVYGPCLSNARIITLAPEQDTNGEVIRACTKQSIVMSVGHSEATLEQGELAVLSGARLITHLFNAMASFHHRDPGLLGLLTSVKIPQDSIFYGIIADGIHTHPAALRIAYRTNFQSMCLVTDAISAMGLKKGLYKLGDQTIQVTDERATIAGMTKS